MSDYFNDDFYNRTTHYADEPAAEPFEDIAQPAQEEGSYEWNAESDRSGEYHYSYINGNNSDAAHNPNNYENAYAQPAAESYDEPQTHTEDVRPQPNMADSFTENFYSAENYADNAYAGNYGYRQAPQYSAPAQTAQPAQKKQKKKREKKGASRGFVAAALAIAVLGSSAIGFGGGLIASNMNKGSSAGASGSSMTINQVAAKSDSETGATNASSGETTTVTTSDIVKKTANSVVEIQTESVTTGSFARQYVTQGAGSGVIISEDGYIVTNHHVIDGANKITVTLRDGTTTYDAQLIGSDEDNDIALIKIDASGLSAATFGNSSDLVVGDYVVAIGNPLGTLGGTVTDGIISALAREVNIEGKQMTLLQTNAQISPGNSGGGLFNANGELVGIVNAKDSATEVEGIAFAIPVNNVLNIIKDLKDYGYVTGKIDLGMEFVDINSYDTAFYYNVNQLGCYVLSVKSGSNAESAGFKSGDRIISVNGTEVSSSSEITKALENAKVGDTAAFTISRNGGRSTETVNLTLTEYVPTVKPGDQDSQGYKDYQSNDYLWQDLINW